MRKNRTAKSPLLHRKLQLVASGMLLLGGLPLAASDAIISLNVATSSSGNTAIDGEEVFGVASEETVVGNWNHITNFGASNPTSNLIRHDGTASGVEVTGRNGGGEQYWGSTYINTPWNYGLAHFVGTTGPVSLTFNNLNAEFPFGYYALVYVNGPVQNQGAAVTDGATTYFFRTLDSPNATPVKITHTAADGVYPEGNYAVFGSAESPLTANSITFSIPTGSVVSNNAGIGGVQLVAVPRLGPQDYFLDAVHGDDGHNGLSPQTAWKTLSRLDNAVFGPGDRILFRRGDVFPGRFTLQGSGTPESPVVIGAYGEGPKPRLEGEPNALEVILIGNGEGIEIRDLHISNNRPWSQHPNSYGIRIQATDGAGELPHLLFHNLDFVDIRGSGNDHESRGILALTGENDDASPATRWNGFVVENCHFENIDGRAVQLIDYSHSLADHRLRGYPYFPTVGFVFQNNTGLNIHRNLLMIRGTQGALIQHNQMSGTALGSAFWAFDAEGTIVQFNDFRHLRRSSADSYVCHFDYNCVDTVMQYNFGYDVEGGLIQIIVDSSWLGFQENAVARYNVGVDVGFRGAPNSAGIFYSGRVTGSKVYNNTVVYRNLHGAYKGISVHDWGGEWPNSNLTHNNLFYAAGSPVTHNAAWRLQEQGNVLSHNLYHGNIPTPNADQAPIVGDPKLLDPLGMDPEDFRVSYGSAAIGAGLPIAGNGGRDYFGNGVSPEAAPTVGFHEYQTDRWIDSNGDGLPDEWKSRHGFAPDEEVDVDADEDGDSWTLHEEFLADTDPRDPGSFFALKAERSPVAKSLLLDWEASADRVYHLYHSLDLVDWHLVEPEPVTPPHEIDVAEETEGRRFFKLQATLPE